MVDRFNGEDRSLLTVSPSGERLLTVTHDQDTLAVHRVASGSVEATINAAAVPQHLESEPEDDEDEAFFDYEGGFIDETNAVVSTVESDEQFGAGRHWLLDTTLMRITELVSYPQPVSGLPTALGDGTWYTRSATENALQVWALHRMD